MSDIPAGLSREQSAVWLSTQVAIAASGMDDGPRVLGLVKALADELAEGRVELRPVPKPELVEGQPFMGRPMQAKFSGACVVCSKQIKAGESILYSADLKRAAHSGCGEVDTTRRARP